MSTLLVIRDTCKEYYRKFEWIINPILKFIAAFMVFSLINKEIGYDSRLLKSIIRSIVMIILIRLREL